MVKLRTAQEACDDIKSQDSQSALSVFLIKKLATQGKIRSIKTGKKLLIDYDSLIAFLNGQTYELPLSQILID